MNKKRLKQSVGTRVHLQPKAKTVAEGLLLPQQDDVWIIQTVHPDGAVELKNTSTDYVAKLGADNIYNFDSNNQLSADGAKHGFLTLTVQIFTSSRGIWIQPLPQYIKRRLLGGKKGAELANAETDRKALTLLERKLLETFRIEDDRARDQIRAQWNLVNSSQTCPSIGVVMDHIKRICAASLNQRGLEMMRVLMQHLDSLSESVTSAFFPAATKVIEKSFPKNIHLEFAKKTTDVFQRKGVPTTKFSERVFQLNVSLIEVDCLNRSSRAIASAHLLLEELHLLLGK